jgi:hypothetical protein
VLPLRDSSSSRAIEIESSFLAVLKALGSLPLQHEVRSALHRPCLPVYASGILCHIHGLKFKTAHYQKAREQIDARMNIHLAAHFESYRSQFPTIQEFAASRFDCFNHPAYPGAKVPVVDLEQFTTIDQVIDAWTRQAEAEDAAEDAAEAGWTARTPPSTPEPS